jgi:DHA2 family multidrug resistance protein
VKRLFAALSPPVMNPRVADGSRPPLPGPPRPTWRIALGLVGALIGGIMSLVNTRLTAFGVADLRGAVGLDLNLASWVTTAFSVGSIVIVPATPWLAGIFSTRRLLVGCVILTLVSALALGTVPPYHVLVFLRFVQGVGSGALVPLLLMSVLRFTPLPQRIWGIAMYACITTLSPAVTETITGWFTEYYTWKAIFWQNAALAPVAVALVMIGLPIEPMRLSVFRETDYFALIFCIVGVGALTAAVSEGQTLDWFDSGTIVGLFVIAGICLLAFIVNELTCKRPLIDVRLVTHINFTMGLVVLLTFNFAMLGAYYVLPQYATQVHNWRELQIGAILGWLALPQIVLSPLAALLLRYVDARVVLACGLAMFAVGARMATSITADWAMADFMPSQLVQACAFPFIMCPLVLIVTSSFQISEAASGGALFNIVRSFAGTFGTAIVGAVITVRERVHSALILLNVHAGTATPASLPSVAARARVQAYVMSYADAFGLIGLIAIATMVMLLLLRSTPVPLPSRPQASTAGRSAARPVFMGRAWRARVFSG